MQHISVLPGAPGTMLRIEMTKKSKFQPSFVCELETLMWLAYRPRLVFLASVELAFTPGCIGMHGFDERSARSQITSLFCCHFNLVKPSEILRNGEVSGFQARAPFQ